MAWNIANGNTNTNPYNDESHVNNDNSWTSQKVDERTRLQALALASDCYKYKMDLVTNGVVITDALKAVQQNKQELNQIDSILLDSNL